MRSEFIGMAGGMGGGATVIVQPQP
jgi:hypothetical protein